MSTGPSSKPPQTYRHLPNLNKALGVAAGAGRRPLLARLVCCSWGKQQNTKEGKENLLAQRPGLAPAAVKNNKTNLVAQIAAWHQVPGQAHLHASGSQHR